MQHRCIYLGDYMHAKTELCSSSEAYCLTVYAFVVDSSVIYEPFFVVPRTTNYVRCLQTCMRYPNRSF